MTVSTKPWWTKDTIAVVTGANKGIGYEIVRDFAKKGLTVVLTARSQSSGQAALDSLKAEGLKSVTFHLLDVDSEESIQTLATWLKRQFGGIDILINNAAINSGPNGHRVDETNAKAIVRTNYYGVKNVTKALLPLLRASPAGARIVNVSARLGLYDRLRSPSLKKTFQAEDKYTEELVDSLAAKYLDDVTAGTWDGWCEGINKAVPMYSESKMFLNAYASALAKTLAKSQPEDHQILVVTYCPGATLTDMLDRSFKDGFHPPPQFAIKTVADGADTGVWLALLPKEELAPKIGKLYAERTEYQFGWTTSGL